MAPVKNKTSPWFRHPSGIGWVCLNPECKRANSLRVQKCSGCG